ncbi:hypothetical protein ACS0TY_029093 [Phlomoides rotata]
MLQRQIMFKQMQELQRRQQLQDLGGGRNQDYMSLKQASPDGAPIHDSQMLMVDNTQMIQQDESDIFQGFSSGLVLPQSHNSNTLGSMGLSPPQYGMSLYNPPPNIDMNLNLYSHLQDPSNHSVNQLTKNTMHPSALASSFMGRQGNFSSDQISMPDGSLLPNHVFQEKNLFGQISLQSFTSDLSSLNYSPQGITTKRNTSIVESEGRHEDIGWAGISPGKVSKIGMSEADDSLDPLEQKFLYSTDDHSWESSFGSSSKMGTGGFESTVENPSFMDTSLSIQSGSWSALMQSAVAETSSSDTAVQEEWGGLSFQNPKPSSDNQLSNFIDSEKPQDNWVDRNLHSASSPSSEPDQLFQKSSMKSSFPGFQQSGHQYLKQNDEFHSLSSLPTGQHSPSSVSHLADYNSHLKHPTGGSQLGQASLHSEGQGLKDTVWLGSSSNSGGIQTQFDQLNQLNIHRSSQESQKMNSGENIEPASTHLGASSDIHGQTVTSQSRPESRGFEFRPGPADSGTPQSYSFFPSLSMGNSSVASLPSHYEKDYFNNPHPASPVQSHVTAKLPSYSAASSLTDFQLRTSNAGGSRFPLLESAAITQSSGASVVPQLAGFPTGLPTAWPDITTQREVSSNFLQSPGSASSSLETSLGEQPSQNCNKHESYADYEQRPHNVRFVHEGPNEMHNPTPLSRNPDTLQPLRKHYSEVDGVASGSLMTHTTQRLPDQEQKDYQIYSLMHQLRNPRDGLTDCGERFPFKQENIDYQQAIAKARGLLSGQNLVVQDKAKSDQEAVQVGASSPGVNKGWNFSQEAREDQLGKASSAAYLQNFQQMEMLGQDDSQNNSIGSNQASNLAYQSQINWQMDPSWFKHYGTLKNGQELPQPFSGLSIGKLQENSLIMQVNSVNSSQGSGISSPPTTLVASKELSPSSMLPSDVMYHNLDVSKLKKRKVFAFGMVPWHKEVNCEAPMPQNISEAEFEWAHASNRKQEEATKENEIVDDVLPVVRAKRRLIFTTQLMKQVFRPAPAGILFEDAGTNCECLAYSAARLALGDSCNLITKLPSNSNDVSPNKLKASKRNTASDFSKVVECLISRVKKLEGDLSRLDQNLSIASIKVESQELEKFATLNRFAKFHIKAHSSTVDAVSSSAPSTVQKAIPQRYVIALPMPKILPEVTDCIPL